MTDGRHQALNLRLGNPTRNSEHILKQVRHRLERFKPGGPSPPLILTLPNPSPFDGRQLDLRDPQRTDEAIETVSARLQDAPGKSQRSHRPHHSEGTDRRGLGDLSPSVPQFLETPPVAPPLTQRHTQQIPSMYGWAIRLLCLLNGHPSC